MEFQSFPKMARLRRDVVVSEKIDGTSAQVCIALVEDVDEELSVSIVAVVNGFAVFAGSRTRWVTPEDDNFGFAAWVKDNAASLIYLGTGRHYGEWWGQGIQRKYGQTKKHFSLFNCIRWVEHDDEPGPIPTDDPRIFKMQKRAPACCRVVPVLARGTFTTGLVELALDMLRDNGSYAAPGWQSPEGVVVFHVAGNTGFKVTLEKDGEPKGKA